MWQDVAIDWRRSNNKEVFGLEEIRIFATGGTIASTPDASGAYQASVPVESLMTGMRVAGGTKIVTEDFLGINSFNLTLDMLFRLTQEIDAALAEPEVLGAVVTHGTDTIEETAMFLSLFLTSNKTVVITGAQLAPSLPGADGQRNVQDSLDLLQDQKGRELGVVVLFDGLFFDPRGVRKINTLAISAFDSPFGPLGEMRNAELILHRDKFQVGKLALPSSSSEAPRVEIINSYLGVDASQITSAIADGSQGFVIEGMGAGNPGSLITSVAKPLMETDFPIVLSSRVPFGHVAGLYGNGGGSDLTQLGVPEGGHLRSPQLRILLTAALWSSSSTKDAMHFVRNYLRPVSD